MKFLCVSCDEPMKLTRTAPPDAAGSLSVLFACPACGREIAMLTNPMETDMISSLGVRIGPASADGAAPAAAGEPAPASRCPFSGVVREMEESAARQPSAPAWTPAALARLANIPDFVRPMAKQGIEHYAASSGYPEIDERVLDEVRERFGM
ncbi:MAG TPA: PCP reductase family protein [Thermoanaerobaculia bacterium]|nr:PCP reductase family protein [Thermoanaerobaculia bacterium]